MTATNSLGTTDGADATFTTPTVAPPPPGKKCTVPKVVGMLLPAAKKRITKAHCRVGKIRFKSAPKKKRNRVLSQSPKPGKRLKKGARVNLVVGRVKH